MDYIDISILSFHKGMTNKIKEIEMSDKKDVTQFEMGTDGRCFTRSSLSPQDLEFKVIGEEWEHENLKPNTQYAVRMIAVPDGYRVATYEEARACIGGKAFAFDGWAAMSEIMCIDKGQYIVPKETEEDRRKKRIMDRIEAAEEELRNAKEELNKGDK
jgi:hypothetical protein